MIHPDPKQMMPASKSLGSINFGNLTTKPTAIMNMPNSSRALAAWYTRRALALARVQR